MIVCRLGGSVARRTGRGFANGQPSTVSIAERSDGGGGGHAHLKTLQPGGNAFTAADKAVCPDMPLMFDTHKLVSYLKHGGFTQTQSEALTNAMVRISQQADRHHASQMVTKSEFVSLRSELSILEKADFALLKTDINAIEKRMETSVAEIYTAVERVENRVIKWVIAVAGAIGLAIVRMTTTSSGGDASSRGGVSRPPSNVAAAVGGGDAGMACRAGVDRRACSGCLACRHGVVDRIDT